MTSITRKKISAHKFREIQDDILGVDNLDMARLIGLKLDSRSNAIRSVERYRNGTKPISGVLATLLWYIINTEDRPPWMPQHLEL